MTAPADVDAGDVVTVGSIVGVAVVSAKSGTSVPLRVEGVFSGLAPAGSSEGDALFWDADAEELTTTATDNIRCGTVLAGNLVRLAQS